MDSKPGKLTANEVIVFDSSTFVREAGLTSSGASALKHYLFRWGTQLAVPEVVVKECERHLAERATGKVHQRDRSRERAASCALHQGRNVGGQRAPDRKRRALHQAEIGARAGRNWHYAALRGTTWHKIDPYM